MIEKFGLLYLKNIIGLVGLALLILILVSKFILKPLTEFRNRYK